MDEENMQNQQNAENNGDAKREGEGNSGQGGSRPRVHIFGAEIDGGGEDRSKHASETKEEWRKRKDE